MFDPMRGFMQELRLRAAEVLLQWAQSIMPPGVERTTLNLCLLRYCSGLTLLRRHTTRSASSSAAESRKA